MAEKFSCYCGHTSVKQCEGCAPKVQEHHYPDGKCRRIKEVDYGDNLQEIREQLKEKDKQITIKKIQTLRLEEMCQTNWEKVDDLEKENASLRKRIEKAKKAFLKIYDIPTLRVVDGITASISTSELLKIWEALEGE